MQLKYIALRDGIAWGPFASKGEAREWITAHEDMKGARVVTLLTPELLEETD